MPERLVGRHRADVPVKTPLTTITTTLTKVGTDLGDNAAVITRGGAAIALTGGLVATMAVPAGASVGADVQQASVRTAAAGVLTGAAVAAPADARVSFESASFSATGVDLTSRQVSLPRAVTADAAPGDPSAPAAATSGSRSSSAPASSVLVVAARYLGVSYVYGGTTPGGFDCSGYVQYVFRIVGVSLPRTADQQMRASTIVPRSQAKVGDLVFMLDSSGHAYHVGIYAGGDQFYDAGSTGGHVSKRTIFSSDVVFGRV